MPPKLKTRSTSLEKNNANANDPKDVRGKLLMAKLENIDKDTNSAEHQTQMNVSKPSILPFLVLIQSIILKLSKKSARLRRKSFQS